MREARAARLLVGRADVIPDVHGHDGHAGVAMQDDVEPVVERNCRNGTSSGAGGRAEASGCAATPSALKRNDQNERSGRSNTAASPAPRAAIASTILQRARRARQARASSGPPLESHADEATARALGVARSLAMYYGIPFRARRLRRFYSQFVHARRAVLRRRRARRQSRAVLAPARRARRRHRAAARLRPHPALALRPRRRRRDRAAGRRPHRRQRRALVQRAHADGHDAVASVGRERAARARLRESAAGRAASASTSSRCSRSSSATASPRSSKSTSKASRPRCSPVSRRPCARCRSSTCRRRATSRSTASSGSRSSRQYRYNWSLGETHRLCERALARRRRHARALDRPAEGRAVGRRLRRARRRVTASARRARTSRAAAPRAPAA